MNKRKCVEDEEGVGSESKKAKVEEVYGQLVLSNGAIAHCILNYLDLKTIRTVRLVSKAISRTCLYFMLDRFIFIMNAIQVYAPEVLEKGLESALPKVPRRVYCDKNEQLKLVQGCEDLTLDYRNMKTTEVQWPSSVVNLCFKYMVGVKRSIGETTLRLPEGATNITFKYCTLREGENIIWPKTIVSTRIARSCKVMSTLPPWLRSLTIKEFKPNNVCLKNLPPSLEYLDITKLRSIEEPPSDLPIGLKTLCLPRYAFDLPLNNLPPGLERLIIRGKWYDLPFHRFHRMCKLPDSIVYLDTGGCYLGLFERWPASLKRLVLSNFYKCTLPEALLNQIDRLYSRFGLGNCEDEYLPEPFRSAAKIGKLSRKAIME